MPMNPRLLRPSGVAYHPEATAWKAAVAANGGSVSPSTLKAVSDFCKDIDGYGIRDRFYRLSLVCGSNRNAALVPLYRGPSATGTQLADTTDTGVSIVDGDYSEASGIQGSQSIGKSLRCATYPISNMFPAGNDRQEGHLCAAFAGASSTLVGDLMGVNIGSPDRYALQTRIGFSRSQSWGGRGVNWTVPDALFHIAIKTRNAGTHTLYVDGASAGASTGSATTPNTNCAFHVLGTGSAAGSNAAGTQFEGRIAAYSVGAGLTSQQAADLRTALVDFFAAIGRT